jgi:hypothetical protein
MSWYPGKRIGRLIREFRGEVRECEKPELTPEEKVRKAAEEVDEVAFKMTKKTKTEDGYHSMSGMGVVARDLANAALLCDPEALLRAAEDIGACYKLWERFEDPDDEDRYEVKSAIIKLYEAAAEVLEKRCGFKRGPVPYTPAY